MKPGGAASRRQKTPRVANDPTKRHDDVVTDRFEIGADHDVIEETKAAGPVHTEETIQEIASLHTEHHASATLYQRLVDRVIALLTRPVFIIALTISLLAWVGANGLLWFLGLAAPDPPPYQGLSCFIGVVSLYFVVLVLAAQRRDASLERRRELLTLELAIFNDQKTTKIISLLEELRRDLPTVHDRVDEQAAAMARHADPQTALEAIKEARSEQDRG